MNEDAVLKEVRVGEQDVLSFLKPDTLWGALIYLVLFVLLASIVSRVFRAAVHASMTPETIPIMGQCLCNIAQGCERYCTDRRMAAW